MSAQSRTAVVAATLALVALLAVACGDDDGGSILDRLPELERPTTEGDGEAVAPPEQPVEPEVPVEPEAPVEPEVPVEPEASDDDGSGSRWLAVLLVVAVLVLAAGLAAAIFRRRPGSEPHAGSSVPRQQAIGSLRWLHDQLSLELLAGPGPAAAQRWAVERPRVDAMAVECHQLGVAEGEELWGELAAATSSLAGALDTAITVRSADDVDPAVVSEAIAVVQRHRRELLDLLEVALERP